MQLNNPVKSRVFFYSFFIAIVLRVVHLLTPTMSSDHAIIGLGGMHITQGNFPMFFYGGHFEFAIESYLAAPLFLIFGPSRLVLCSVPALMSLLWIYVIYRLALKIFDEQTALFTLLLAAIGPALFLASTVIPLQGYIETGILGALSLILTYMIVYEKRNEKRWYFLLGLILGFSFLLQFHIVPYALTVGLFLFINDPKIICKRVFYLMLAGFFLGCSPLVIYNLLSGWKTFQEVGGLMAESTLGQALQQLFGIGWWVMFGARNENALRETLPVFSPFIMVVYLLSFLYLVVKRKRGGGLLLAVLLFFILTYWQSGRGASNTRRYLLPLYSVTPVMLGYFITGIWRRSRVAAYGLTAVILAANIYFSLLLMPILSGPSFNGYRATGERDRRLFNFLSAQRIKGVYTYSWWISMRLNFAGAEKIIFTNINNEPYPPYQQFVDQQTQPAWLTHSQELLPSFEAIACQYKKHFIPNPVAEVPPFWIFYDLQTTGQVLEEIADDSWQATASHNAQTAAYALDGNVASYWCSAQPQRQGMSFTVDLGEIYPDLTRLWFNPGPSTDYPAAYKLYLSADGVRWKLAAQNDNFYRPIFWDGPHPFMRNVNGMIETDFTPRSARYLKIVLSRADSVPWSIAEIYVYRRRHKAEIDWDVSELVARIDTLAVKKVYADPWTAAHIDEEIYQQEKSDTYFSTYTYGYFLVKLRKLRHYAFVVLKENFPDFEEQMDEFPFNTEEYGPYVLVTFAKDLKTSRYDSLYWDGFHLSRCQAE